MSKQPPLCATVGKAESESLFLPFFYFTWNETCECVLKQQTPSDCFVCTRLLMVHTWQCLFSHLGRLLCSSSGKISSRKQQLLTFFAHFFCAVSFKLDTPHASVMLCHIPAPRAKDALAFGNPESTPLEPQRVVFVGVQGQPGISWHQGEVGAVCCGRACGRTSDSRWRCGCFHTKLTKHLEAGLLNGETAAQCPSDSHHTARTQPTSGQTDTHTKKGSSVDRM